MTIDTTEINRAVREMRTGVDPLFAEVEKVIVGHDA